MAGRGGRLWEPQSENRGFNLGEGNLAPALVGHDPPSVLTCAGQLGAVSLAGRWGYPAAKWV